MLLEITTIFALLVLKLFTTVLYPKVVLPDFITSCSLLLMVSPPFLPPFFTMMLHKSTK